MTLTLTDGAVFTAAEEFRNRVGVTDKVTPLAGMSEIFENGVLTTVRIGAERFGFSVRLNELGIVPTRSKSKDKTQASINAVLRGAQRASLLPRDEMWYLNENNARVAIPRPENSERQIRMLFPTRYDAPVADQDQESNETKTRNPIAISAPTIWAVPMNGMTFIPESSFTRWKKDYDNAREVHMKTAAIIVDNYARLMASSVRHYEHIALDVYNRLLQTSPSTLTGVTALEFTRRWKRAVVRSWPTKEDIIRNFTVEAQFYWVPLPSRITEDIRRKQEIEWDIENQRTERRVRSEIATVVSQTQSTQVHELTVSYVKTILERTEHVFLNFLNFLDEKDRSPSPQQLNAVLKVVDMIRVLGSGVSSFDSIREQAESIASLIEVHKTTMSSTKVKGGKARLRATDSQLPEAIAQAVAMIRVEAEGMIGHEARRTTYSDENPMEILQSIWSSDDDRKSSRKIIDTQKDDEEFLDAAWEFIQNEAELAEAAITRQILHSAE